MISDSAIPVQKSMTIIEIRPHRGGWQCFEAPGVQPFWTGAAAKEDAVGYAKARAKFAHGEIRVLKGDGSVDEVIPLGKIDSPETNLLIERSPIMSLREQHFR